MDTQTNIFVQQAQAATCNHPCEYLHENVGLRILNDHIKIPQDNTLRDVLQILARNPKAFHVESFMSIIKKNFNMTYGSIYWLVFLLLLRVLAIIGNLVKIRTLKESNAIPLLRLLWRMILLEKPKNTIDDILKGQETEIGTDSSHVLFIAARMNNSEFLVELIREYPDLICMKNNDGQTIFHISVSHRYHKIYNLLYEIGSKKDLITTMTDQQGNNILHLVGMNPEKNPDEDLFAPPFKLRRELIWYKKVKAMVPPPCRDVKNAAGKTPKEIFYENHKDLVCQGEKWIKESVRQSMVVATLVTAVGYSVGISIPGGYDKDEGLPLLINNKDFIDFIIYDAVSFVLSSISILIFLYISISHHTQKDFKFFLPMQMYLGHGALLTSILGLLTAFLKNLSTMYEDKSNVLASFANFATVLIGLIIFGLIPVIATTYLFNDPFWWKKRRVY